MDVLSACFLFFLATCCKQSVADMPNCGPGFEHGCTNKNLGIHDTGTIRVDDITAFCYGRDPQAINPNYCYDGQDPVCCPIGMLTFPSPLSPRSRMAAAQVDLARLPGRNISK
ncbi:hypothetical protein MJO28_007972 [Puccinia striiformis f. sp. tritici]|uniref:Uncharacterized protein n=1 Tax=Puccinia striiformis f. sp. tritici TaxID=168172 RepID=A0ACC0EAW0_9BASI|nr:hypothetical protein MJO28_007972 [Puccinia striiformis f. sp. tritici]